MSKALKFGLKSARFNDIDLQLLYLLLIGPSNYADPSV